MKRNLFVLVFVALGGPLGMAAMDMTKTASTEMGDNSHLDRHQSMGPSECGEMEVWDYAVGMCRPLPMRDMPMTMLMIHGNGFLTQGFEEGPRGRNALSAPNMFMADLGTSMGDRQYLNLDLMGTLERWTYPDKGYPEPMQIGEQNSNGVPYIDAQHPHSSPIMGLTLSDTITLGHEKDYLKFSLAPRGQSTDGPVAFMHRPTGVVNPDAPLGHHIGQDVGHISSTVVGAAVRLGATTFEISSFNGTEPKPANVDLPLRSPNSYAARMTQEFSPHFFAMASAAYVKNPEPDDSDLDHIWRYSGSVYFDHMFENGWMIHNSLIYGLVNNYDHVSALNSFAEEIWLHKQKASLWSRIESLQRTAGELSIASAVPFDPYWVTALTIGYTHKIAESDSADVGAGASITKDFLPPNFQSAYSGDPISGKVFLQVSGMKMWDL